MGPSDMPKEPPKQVEVSPAKGNGEVSKFLDQWLSSKSSDKTGGKMGESIGIGQVAEMNLPPGWKEGQPEKSGSGTSSFREFHAADSPEAKLCFYYRGRRISEEGGRHFHNLLEKPPHNLSAEEVQSLGEALRDRANPDDFNMLVAKTEDINGKRVLVIEGRYKEIQQDTRALLVDSDGSGTAVQEIYYQAPKDLFPKYLLAASSAMKSIQWKGSGL